MILPRHCPLKSKSKKGFQDKFCDFPKTMRVIYKDSTDRSVIIFGDSILAKNSNKARNNYFKYSLPNPATRVHIFNIRAEKKPK